MNHYFQEVLDVHILIGRWLGDPDSSSDVCDKLLARFSPDYSMVTTDGARLDYSSLVTFFRSQCGCRKGLEIEIENMQLIAESTTGATVTYQERQKMPDQDETIRFSTVVFESGKDNQIMWRHLHETALPL